jgi:hypothetical protein
LQKLSIKFEVSSDGAFVQAGDHGDNAGETFRLAEAASPGRAAFSPDSASFLKAGLDSAI